VAKRAFPDDIAEAEADRRGPEGLNPGPKVELAAMSAATAAASSTAPPAASVWINRWNGVTSLSIGSVGNRGRNVRLLRC
jgi:hypothetical protein